MINKKITTWQRIRKFFQDIHLWLGLASGLVIIAVCLSGTIYVYNAELIEMAAPHLYEVKPVAGVKRIPAENFLNKIEDVSGGRVTTVSVFANPEATYQFNTKAEGDKSRRGTAYFVNPYTGAIVGTSKEENSMKDFMRSMFSLHRWLLLDKIETPIFSGISNRELGSKITGWATIIFTLGCITGLVIWFPNKIKNWRQGLKIKTKANWKRINHDLHNSLALYALIFLLLMGITGPQWSFDWYRAGLRKTLGTYVQKPERNEKTEKSIAATAHLLQENKEFKSSASSMSISALLNIADNRLPYIGNYRISLPKEGDNMVVLRKTKTGFFAPAAADRIEINSLNGAIAKVDIFSDRPFNERIAGSIKALHVGNVFGHFTKLLYFLACLIATSLPITGTLIWINKLKKKRKKTLKNTSFRKKINLEAVVVD